MGCIAIETLELRRSSSREVREGIATFAAPQKMDELFKRLLLFYLPTVVEFTIL
jgi:hypothetical protein